MMNTVCTKDKCYGCGACLDICPKGVITLERALFSYNAIRNEGCINCHACETICQRVNAVTLTRPLKWFQGWALSDQRNVSTSGGVATEVCRVFAQNGGYVCSCFFSNGQFCFNIYNSPENAGKSTGSKYVKSDISTSLRSIRTLLQDGNEVLFIGLPCQVGAIKKYVGPKLQEKLYTVDIICHGTPSVDLLEKFIGQYDYKLENVESIDFRKNNSYRVAVNKKDICPSYILDYYTIAFINAISFTDNCYSCQYATFDRASDLTLGDAWGSELSEDEIKKGISLILCQTEKGDILLRNANLHTESVNIENVRENNHQLNAPVGLPKERKVFVDSVVHGDSFNKAVKKALPWISMKQEAKRIIYHTRSSNHSK